MMIFAYQKTVDLCTWHYDKKNSPHFFYLKKFNFFFSVRENPFNAQCKRQINCKFQFHSKICKAFIGNRMKRKNSSFFSVNTRKRDYKFLLGYDIRIPTMILFWFNLIEL